MRHIVAMLNLSDFGPDVSAQDLLGWARIYRGKRDEGANPDAAAAEATAGLAVWHAEAGPLK